MKGKMRGIYSGRMPRGVDLPKIGVDAVFISTGGLTVDDVKWAKGQGCRVFGEFNSLHDAQYVRDHPDAQPIGPHREPSPPPNGWQGVCPTHEGYREHRITEFKDVLKTVPLDGVWLDYHHLQADWERPDPALPDTCFCSRCLSSFRAASGISAEPRDLLTKHRKEWTDWRCGVLTDWVREYREVLNRTRPGALLGSFHCPYSEADYNHAMREKLAIDLRAQARFIDVFSPMPYHARYGRTIDWIGSQVRWLGKHLDGTRREIWPIVQLSDWGQAVHEVEVAPVVQAGLTPPATGVIVFKWDSLSQQEAKVRALQSVFSAL